MVGILYNILGVVLFQILRTILSFICCGRCGTSSKIEIEREWNPQFTGVFKRPHEPTLPLTLTDEELSQGWEIYTEKAFGGRREFKVKKALHHHDPNRQGTYLRTWEVLQEQYLSSYDIFKNDEYKAALKATFERINKE